MARNLALNKVSLDTHALYWFFEDPDKLSSITKRILEAQPEFVISVIVLFELLYIEKKSGGLISLTKVLGRLKSHKHTIVPVDEKVFNKSRRIKKDLDIHDRIIVATALLTKTLLITKDEQILKSKTVKAVW
jgi:PIN domain nuclease of toxin-antitoxin system